MGGGSGGGGNGGRGESINIPEDLKTVDYKSMSKSDIEYNIKSSEKHIKLSERMLESIPGKLNEMTLKGWKEENAFWKTVLDKGAYKK